MKKITVIFVVFAVIAVILATVIFTACSKGSDGLTIKKGILQVGLEIGYPPMEYFDENGNPVGFDIEMAKAIGEKLDLKVEFIDTAWDGIFAAVDTKRFDCIISSVTITPAREQVHNFSKPYIQNTLAIVLPKNSGHNIRTPYDLGGLGVAFQNDTTSDFYMQDLAAEGLRFTPYGYEKVIYCFEELRLGRVDVIMTDLLVAYEYISRSPDLEIVWQGGDEEFGICMRKGNDALTNSINKALDELFEEGTMLRLSKDIFGGLDLVSAVRR